jgi:HEAT repeat protein
LIEALRRPELMASAVSALFEISVSMPDPRIADAIVRLMERPTDFYVADKAVSILKELKDPRVAAIGLRLLDNVESVPLNIPSTANAAAAAAHMRSQLRMTGAFAFAKFAQRATDELVTRLAHTNAGIRAAAVAALREDPGQGPHLQNHVKPLLTDPDPAVQQQASMTINWLKPMPPVEIPAEQIAEVQGQAEAMVRQIVARAAARRKNRF